MALCDAGEGFSNCPDRKYQGPEWQEREFAARSLKRYLVGGEPDPDRGPDGVCGVATCTSRSRPGEEGDEGGWQKRKCDAPYGLNNRDREDTSHHSDEA